MQALAKIYRRQNYAECLKQTMQKKESVSPKEYFECVVQTVLLAGGCAPPKREMVSWQHCPQHQATMATRVDRQHYLLQVSKQTK